MIKSDVVRKPSGFFQNSLMFLCILLLPFGDTILGDGYLGIFGTYASSFPIVVLFFLSLTVSKDKKLLWGILLVVIVHYFFSMGLYEYYSGYPNASFIEAAWKSVKIGILFSTVLVFFFIRINYFYLKLGLVVAFALSLIGLAIPENIVPFLHATENFNMRPRGFSQESSHLAQSLGAIGLLLAALCTRNIFAIMVLCVTAFCISFIKSKAGIVLFCTALNVMALHYLVLNRSSLKKLLSGFMAFFVTLSISYFSIVSSVSFWDEVEKDSNEIVFFLIRRLKNSFQEQRLMREKS